MRHGIVKALKLGIFQLQIIFVLSAFQEFIPANGTKKVNEAMDNLQGFVRNVFTPEGEYQDKTYPKSPDKCRFCPYRELPDLCDRKG